MGKPPRVRYTTSVTKTSAPQFAVEIARITHDNKSEDVTVFDLRGISHVTDFAVICTGTSDRQMRAVMEHILEYGRKIGEKPFGLCGAENASWIIIDYVEIVIHIFAKPYRSYYDLELLWGDAPRVDWSRSESA